MIILNPKQVELTPIVAIDLETTGLRPWQHKIDLIAIRTERSTYVLEAEKYSPEFLKGLFREVESQCLVVNHNLKFDMGFILYHYGVLLTNLHCTQVTAQILENGYQKRREFGLTDVLLRYLNIEHADSELVTIGKNKDGTPKQVTRKSLLQKSFIDPKLGPIYKTTPKVREKQISYAAQDVENLIVLYHAQMKLINEKGLQDVYKLEHTVMPVLCDMEVGGCYIDRGPWEELIKTKWIPEQNELISKLNGEVRALLGDKKFKYRTCDEVLKETQFDLFSAPTEKRIDQSTVLNYGSSEQILELIDFLGLSAPVDEEGKASLEEGVLNVYLTENSTTPLYGFIDLLLKYRQITKLISTYGLKMLEKLDAKGRIHTLYTQSQTETFRTSSKSPNLQNIPRPPKGEPDKDIRRFFIAPEGHLLVTCDMDAAEVRIAADYSNEPLLVDSLLQGVDMHSELASISYSIIFGQPVTISKSQEPFTIDGKTYIPDELRTVHKSVTFAKFYKGGAARVYGVLSEYINAHHKAQDRSKIAKQISDALDERMPVLSSYLTKLIEQAQRTLVLTGSKMGGIRHFKKEVYGEAANYKIQRTNAEALKIALINIYRYFKQTGYGRLVMQVHDEVVCEVKEQYATLAAKKIEEIMAQSLEWFLSKIPGKATAHIDKSWHK